MTFTLYDADLTATEVSEKTSDTNLTLQSNAIIPVGKIACIQVAWDNVDGTSADDTTKLSVTDAVGNTWVRAAEAQYSEGVALDGLLAGVFYSVVTTQIEVTTTITITSSAVGTAKAVKLNAFNRDTSKTLEVVAKGYDRGNELQTYTASVSGLNSEEHLWIGVNAMELPSGTNTRDASYSALTANTSNQVGTTGGANADNVSLNSGYLISTGTSETYDNTAQAQGDRVAILVAFREVSAAGGGESVDPFGMAGFFGG